MEEINCRMLLLLPFKLMVTKFWVLRCTCRCLYHQHDVWISRGDKMALHNMPNTLHQQTYLVIAKPAQ